MTARTHGDLLRSLRRVDGWFTVGLVVLVCATLAWSLDDALLVLGRDEYTDFLFWAAIGGVTAGLVGPLVGWGRWKTHLIGAVFAALLVPLLVGWTLIPTGAPPGELFQRTTDSVVQAWSDLALAGRMSTIQFGHHLFALGLLTWATSQFASYAAFGHRRPINAVVVVGSLLLANMALTVRPQLTYLVIFSIASLFLLVRFHTLDEQSDWLRRRIGDPTAISALYLRGGTVFIIAAISGSLLLTNAASSAPLAGAWTDVGARVIEWGQFLERFLPASRSSRSLGPTFGDSTLVGLTWNTSDKLQLRVQFPAEERSRPSWRRPTTTSSGSPAGCAPSRPSCRVTRVPMSWPAPPSMSRRDRATRLSRRPSRRRTPGARSSRQASRARSARCPGSASSGRAATSPGSSATRPVRRTRSRRS